MKQIHSLLASCPGPEFPLRPQELTKNMTLHNHPLSFQKASFLLNAVPNLVYILGSLGPDSKVSVAVGDVCWLLSFHLGRQDLEEWCRTGKS